MSRKQRLYAKNTNTQTDSQKSAPGIMVSGGKIRQSSYDDLSTETLIQDITRMRNGDCIAASSLRIMKMPLVLADYRIDMKEKDQEVIDYLSWWLEKVNYQNYKRHKLLALDYGFALFEKVKESTDYNGKPTTIYGKLSPIQPDTVNMWNYKGIELSGVQHIKNIPNKSSSYVDIEIDNLWLYSYNSEFENPNGSPILRPARKFYLLKDKLITGFGKSAVKGGFIPHVKYKKTIDDTIKKKIETMARNITIEDNVYMSSQEGIYEITLEQITMLGNIPPMLEYCDKQMLFLTSSQFTTIGVNSSGSFAASKTVKTIYELSIQAAKKEIEDNDNQLIKEIIEMSPYAGRFQDDEYPQVKINYTSADLDAVSANMQKMANILNFTPEDQVWLRSLFGMPTIDLTEIQKKDDEKKADDEGDLKKQLFSVQSGKTKNFELSSAVEHYETMAEKASKLVNDMYKKVLESIYSQIEEGKTEINIPYHAEYIHALKVLYGEGFDRGKKDMLKEIGKVKKETKLEKYEFETKTVVKYDKQINKKIDNLYEKLKYKVEEDIDRLGNKITDRGSLQFILHYETFFKRDRSDLEQIVESSYNAGRNTQMELVAEDMPELAFVYSAILDKNLCDVCAGKDGLEYTITEIKNGVEGLSLDKGGYGINDECEGHKGGNRCRCVWIAV